MQSSYVTSTQALQTVKSFWHALPVGHLWVTEMGFIIILQFIFTQFLEFLCSHCCYHAMKIPMFIVHNGANECSSNYYWKKIQKNTLFKDKRKKKKKTFRKLEKYPQFETKSPYVWKSGLMLRFLLYQMESQRTRVLCNVGVRNTFFSPHLRKWT